MGCVEKVEGDKECTSETHTQRQKGKREKKEENRKLAASAGEPLSNNNITYSPKFHPHLLSAQPFRPGSRIYANVKS